MLAMQGALGTNPLDALPEFLNPCPNTAPIKLQLLLAGSASADAASKSGENSSLPRQARQQIIQLRQLHLELSFPRSCASGEDVEDKLCAVDDFEAKGLFEVSKLSGREVVIKDDAGGAGAVCQRASFFDFAPADQCGGIRPRRALQQAAQHLG